jgi:hypothetical protein
MYGRYTSQGFAHVARTVRHHIGTAYATGRHYAHRIDQGVQLASKVYAAAAPVIKDVAPMFEAKASKGVAQAKGSYDILRGDVVDVHAKGQAHAKKLHDVGAMLGL